MTRVHENLGRVKEGPVRARPATACGAVAGMLFRAMMFPALFVLILFGTFLYAARWLIYFSVALLSMVYALGSERYVYFFPLAFLAPLFAGGLIDGIVLLVGDRLHQRRGE
jgi:hypothetical protein